MKNISIIGGGSWGTTLGNVLADNGHNVKVYMRDSKASAEFNKNHTLNKYLPNVKFNDSMISTDDINEAGDCEIAVFAIPSQSIRSVLEEHSDLFQNCIVVNVSKGIEIKTGKVLSEVFAEFINKDNFVALSGPTHAEEVAIKLPTTIVSSSVSIKNMEIIQDVFMNDYFRVYTNPDLMGVEIGGATKNVLSLGIGIIDGLGYGDNSKAAILTRGIHEIVRLGECLGAESKTFYGLTGIGDLIATSTSVHSRNRQAGILIGKGYSLEETEKEVGMVVEGIKTTKAVYELSRNLEVDMPITTEIYKLIYEDSNLESAYTKLMLRDRKEETL